MCKRSEGQKPRIYLATVLLLCIKHVQSKLVPTGIIRGQRQSKWDWVHHIAVLVVVLGECGRLMCMV